MALHCICEGVALQPYTPAIVKARHLWSNGVFANCDQQDVTEAMGMLLNSLDEVERQNVPTELPTPMWELLGVASEQRLTCNVCGYSSHSRVQNISIALDVPSGSSSIDELLSHFWGEQKLKEGDDPYRCPAATPCPTNSKVQRFEEPTHWPPVLIVTLKRWASSRHGLVKIDDEVRFAEILQVDPGAVSYHLCGLIQHGGVAGGGHYTAYVRVTGEQWFLFDDACEPRAVSTQELYNAQPYVLIYERSG